MIHKCFLDTETTGLDPIKDEVHQVACIITDVDNNPVGGCNYKFRPSDEALNQMSYEALDKCNLTVEQIRNRKTSSKVAYNTFCSMISEFTSINGKRSKMLFFAYNSPFDEAFMRKWMSQGDTSYGDVYYYPSLCVCREFAWITQNMRDKMPSMSLSEVCKYLNIEFDESKAHDAMYDVKKTFELYKKVEE
jgi:DNA polymerase III alpha subunit (gram-positive type)